MLCRLVACLCLLLANSIPLLTCLSVNHSSDQMHKIRRRKKMEYNSLEKKRKETLTKIHGKAPKFLGVSECLSREDTMEAVRPKKGSRGSARPGSSRSSSSRASQKSSGYDKKSKSTPAPDVEKEVTFDDEFQADVGFVAEDTDSDDSELDLEQDEIQAQGPEIDEDGEPDEEALRAELGGESDEKEPAAMKDEAKAIEDNKDTKDKKSSEEEEEEKENLKGTKKRGRRLKKTVEKRVGFDGREVVFVTEFTQTDWRWKDTIIKTGRGTVITPSSGSESASSHKSTGLKSILVKPESRQTVSQAHTEEESTQDDRTGTDLTPFSLQPNDEFGIPMLDMSSDSDSSDGESPKKPKTYRHHLPSIGPPQILKYIRESDQLEKETEKGSSDMDEDYRQFESTDYAVDEQGNAVGMFNGPCEFCGDDIKPFPTLEQQLAQPPESLYCCEEYREFVEFAMTTAARLEEDVAKKNEKISVKVHGHHGSKQARKMAKEQAVQRMRERELQRRQQEATGIQAAFYQSATSGQGGGAPRGPKGGQPGGGAMMFKDMDPGMQDGEGDNGTDAVGGSRRMSKRKGRAGKDVGGGGGGNGEGWRDGGVRGGREVMSGDRGGILVPGSSSHLTGSHAGFGSDRGGILSGAHQGSGTGSHVSFSRLSVPGAWGFKQGGGGSGGGAEGAGGGQVTHSFSLATSQGDSSGAFSAMGTHTLSTEVARQMKTINYQLSSQRCLEEGWTLRAPSPLDLDDLDNETFVPEPLHPAMIASGKVHGRNLIEKFYPDGSKFLTMFPDGTGNVFYPSGRLAINISSISLGQNLYVVQDDADEPAILGVFEPNGNGCCYFANGKVRLTYDQMEGMELDYSGGRKRVWSWRDQETHVHAPPFQPIVFGMNRFLGIRFMAQESIALTLTGRKRSCRFNVGARLKLVAPENIQPKGIDEHELFIKECSVKVETILNKVTNLLKFPKSPKVDRILPPLSVSARQQKVDKMRREYSAVPPAQPPGRKPRKVKQTRLSPLDPPPTVTVN